MPSNYGTVASSIAKLLNTKILLTYQVTIRYNYNGLEGTPEVSTYDISPGGSAGFEISSPYELLQVVLTATLTNGLDEDYYSNPVAGEYVRFEIAGLSNAATGGGITNGLGQVSETFTGEEWANSFNGEIVKAIFDGNVLLPSESGYVTITEAAMVTSISLFGKIYTEDTNTSTSYIISGNTLDTPNFSITTDYYSPEFDPDYIQNVTLEATLLDSLGNPISGQSVYFYLTPLYGGSPIQIGDSSLSEGSSSSSTMITALNGKIQKVYSSPAWVNEDYVSYTITAVFDGSIDGSLQASTSPSGRIYFSSS